MNGTFFVELPCIDCDTKPLNGEVAYYPPEFTNPIQDFFANMGLNEVDYQVTYTAGHYGDQNHQWTFTHHEVYQPENPDLPTMVILRYKPSHV